MAMSAGTAGAALGTFELVDRTVDVKELSSRIVLKVKYKADGSYDKHKARLVTRGFEDLFS